MIRNQIVTRFDYPLAPGMDVTILKKKPSPNLTLRKMNLLYEDEHLLVIEKSAGLLSVATAKENHGYNPQSKLRGIRPSALRDCSTNQFQCAALSELEFHNEETAFSILKSYVKKSRHRAELYIIHRLDRDTSGIMMFAKSKEIQLKLQDNWEKAVTKRIYYAVVEGHVKNAEGEIVSHLKENKSLTVYSSKTPGDGQKAVTRYRVLKSNARYSLLEVSLQTGRKNQIRVHLQDIGHSIAGDKKYGAVTNPLGRLGLHAGILEFFHPTTGKRMHFETPVPAVMEKLF
jgi:23S rRNA pseudouridine1911/1915/1917 synthase